VSGIEMFWPRAIFVMAGAAMSVILVVLTCQAPPPPETDEEDTTPRSWTDMLARWSARRRIRAASQQISKPGAVAERSHPGSSDGESTQIIAGPLSDLGRGVSIPL
jgi:hypothetical protein